MTLDILGYLASALIATSLLMRSIVRLRLFNLAGALTFSAYGFLIGATPVGVLNALTASINVVQLVRLQRRREMFRILEVRPNAEYLRYFLDFERGEIGKYFPRFRFDPGATSVALFVLRDLVPAGILLGRIEAEALHVDLDYVIAQYRDLKVGRFLFVDQAEFFRGRGVRWIVTPADTPQHVAYLQRMGFIPVEGTYRLRI